jgi:hypothetical protein
MGCDIFTSLSWLLISTGKPRILRRLSVVGAAGAAGDVIEGDGATAMMAEGKASARECR